ncbi:MAG: efflux RND transporter permease subunit [Bacteroidales bacterium]|jgi:multidrug efflux pump subunit AcrB|nr:efflux RND transporter permease subunit [Bacteroidales bacterium]
MKRKINIIEGAMKHSQIILSFIIVMMGIGAIALVQMPRNEFPDFTIRQGVIVGLVPGATSQEVEEQVTTVVENYIFGYKEVNKLKTYSNSSEGQMIIFVELNENVKDADKFWSKLRHGLSELRMQLPSSVLALIGTNDFGDTSALLITMSSENKSYRELETVMKQLERDIRKVPSVSKIKRYGDQKEKIFIYVQQEKLNEYNVDANTIFTSFKIHEAFNYAGQLDNDELILPVHMPPKYETIDDLAEQIIYSDPQGNIIRLKDIARFERKYDDPDSYIRNNGNNALLLSLEMQTGNNIVQFGEQIIEVLDNFRDKADRDVKINVISNQPEVVDDSISHFMKEFLIAILSVIVVTMILLPFRVSSVAAITIPVSILITMGVMQMVGIQLDIVSLAGLIVVLGMVVDNAIVVIDNHVEKLDTGETPWNAAWKASTELVIPVVSATGAIIAAFMPLMIFLTGMAGDFVGAFPLTIAIALIISLVVAILLVPFICYLFIKKGLHKEDKKSDKKNLLDLIQNLYDTILEKAFRNKSVTITLGILSVVAAVIIFYTTDQQLFPSMDRKQFAVEIYLPEGSSLNKTEEVIDSLERALLMDKRITNVASFVGTGSPRFHTLYAPHMPAKNYGQILVNTVSNDATLELLDHYEKVYRGAFPSANIKWKQLAMESFSAPIEVRISGDDITKLKQTADEITHIISENSNTTWVRNDWLEKRQSISIELDKDKANKLGYSKTLIAASLMTSLNGIPLTTIWEDDYPVKVLLSKEDHLTDDVNDLQNQLVSSILTFESLPLRTVGKLKPEWTEGNIARRNGVRTITVQADVTRGVIYSNVLSQIKPSIDDLELQDGITISYGGEAAEVRKNYIPMGYSLGVSVVLIFFILLLQFKTIRRSLLIMSTMLLSLFGAALGLKLVGYPFGFTSFIGIIGLMGITVRNGIILIDYAMYLVNTEGYTYKQAAIASGKRRMRPIFLTSMAAAIGVVPMILSNSPLWGPLGTVICFGLIFGMILTLFVLPVLYMVSSNSEVKTNSVKEA